MQEEKPRRLGERTVDYGLAVIDYCEGLPRNFSGRHIADQLLRSATSVAANYAEASEAESPADFVHKLSEHLSAGLFVEFQPSADDLKFRDE